ncbi:MAG: hypothetical protein HKN07_06920 [Acidimicrobiia bacterium]|nr:hypothetical protein [Acidimicrobiia bacterium]
MRRLAALALAALLAVGCSGGLESVRGTLIEVDGDLVAVKSFTIRSTGGETLMFEPSDGLLFGTGPLTHLSDHLRSGEPIDVTYKTEGDRLIATAVADGD